MRDELAAEKSRHLISRLDDASSGPDSMPHEAFCANDVQLICLSVSPAPHVVGQGISRTIFPLLLANYSALEEHGT